MIINNVKKTEVVSTEETKKMSINLDDTGFLQMLLSQNLYSAPISSIVRELACNGIDAVIEAGKDPLENPVLVSTYEENDNYFFSVKDTGIGLDEEGFDSILSSYLTSTKRANNSLIGAMGLGSKSPLAYCDSYYWVCRKDGIERKFIVFRGEEFTEYSKMYEVETEEPNGTEVIVPIKRSNSSWGNADLQSFENEMSQQLSYFETVVLVKRGDIVKDYKIYREKEFQFSTLNKSSNMHLCLKDVYYEIDWKKLGMKEIYLPVALRFDLSSGITPNPARESIIYNKETIELIKDKIDKVCTWFINKYNETIKEKDSFLDIIEELNPYQGKILDLYGRLFNVSKLADYGNLDNPTIKGIDKLDLARVYNQKNYLLFDYVGLAEVSNDRYNGKAWFDILSELKRGRNIILVDDKPGKLLLDYIKDTYPNCFFVKKKDTTIPLKVAKKDLHNRDCWYIILDLKRYKKENWRLVLSEFELIRNQLISKFIDIDTIVPTKDWLDARKNNKTKAEVTIVQKEEINPKYAVQMDRESWSTEAWKCKFVSTGPKNISDFRKDVTFIYDKIENRRQLDDLYRIFKNQSSIIICNLVERDVKRIENAGLDNWITISEFMEGKLDIFGEYCTAVLIERLIGKNSVVFKNKEFISKLNPELSKSLKDIQDWSDGVIGYNTNQNNKLLDQMLMICSKESLWSKEIYNVYLEVKEEIKDLRFLQYLSKRNSYGELINDYCLEFAKEYYKSLKTNKIEQEHV